MQLRISKKDLPDPLLSIRRLGYGLLVDRRAGKQSFVKRVHRDLYPRYHLYVEEAGDAWSLNLHLDQRATVYAGVTAHGGEYDGELVEREMQRIEAGLRI